MLRDGPAIPLGYAVDGGEEAVEQCLGVLRAELAGQAGVAHEIDEQHGHVPALGGSIGAVGRAAGQRCTAAATECRPRLVDEFASGASDRQRGSARTAKPTLRGVSGAAPDALHGLANLPLLGSYVQ